MTMGISSAVTPSKISSSRQEGNRPWPLPFRYRSFASSVLEVLPMKVADLPDFRPWYVAAVRLLQSGAVYADDPRVWDILLASRTPLMEYFVRIGLLLVV